MDAASPRIEFDVVTPVDATGLRANVRAALALGLPELADFEYPWQCGLDIIANGPSAKAAPLDSLTKTMALNGALSLFNACRVRPTYWAACDPQEIVADMVEFAPHSTTYLVASTCHPRVFDALLGQKRNVVLWHIHQEAIADLLVGRKTIGPGVSITNMAPELGTTLGFRSFHLHGWDGCFGPNGAGHAVPHGQSYTNDVNIDVNGRLFPTTHAWALEAQDAAARLVGFPFPIHIHGDGMMAAMLSYLLPNRVTRDGAS